jgi:hypothetical protein
MVDILFVLNFTYEAGSVATMVNSETSVKFGSTFQLTPFSDGDVVGRVDSMIFTYFIQISMIDCENLYFI